MANESRDGAALEAALKEGSIQTSGTAQLTGMIDKSDKSGHVHFTPTDCDNWLDLPVGTIASWEIIGRQSCHDHSHAVARLTLKRPKDTGAALYFDLIAQALATQRAGPSPAVTAARAAPVGGIGGQGMCKYYACGTCADGTVMMCDTGELAGCIPNTCSDILAPAFGFASPTFWASHRRGYRL